MDFIVVSDTPAPPTETIQALPQEHTWWTIRAYDQFGSTIHADPRLIKRPENRLPIADAGSNQVVYAGLDGKATVILDGSQSSDPDGDALAFTWALVVGGNAYLSNGVSLTMELPVGVHTFQLMVNDGDGTSQPDEVTITVVAPLECQMKIVPSTINRRSEGRYVLSRIHLPDGFSAMDINYNAPLLIYPGGNPVLRLELANDDSAQSDLLAFFGRNALVASLPRGPTELTVVGTLWSGQTFFARDTVRILDRAPAK